MVRGYAPAVYDGLRCWDGRQTFQYSPYSHSSAVAYFVVGNRDTETHYLLVQRVSQVNLDTLKKHATKENVAKAAGTGVGAATPAAAITAGGAVFHVAGGAAVMKTLAAAVAGALVGGGSIAGVSVVGVVSAATGCGVYRLFNKILK